MCVSTEPQPILRGWSHALAVLPAVAGATTLAVVTRGNPAKQASLIVYGATLTLLFTVSALYHRVRWSPEWRAVWRRLDHATIFVVIAGTYTPVAVNMLGGWVQIAVLAAIWAAAGAGVLLVTAPHDVPRALKVGAYIGVGWTAVLVLPVLYTRVGAVGVMALVAAGVLYSLGAVAYALRRPVLWPRVFGYHEVFHLLVIAATVVLFLFITITVVPTART